MLEHLVVAEAAISVRRPGSFSGLSASISRINSSGFSVGTAFEPIGFLTPRKNSTWAWSSWRVRSPIQMKWPEVA